MEDFFAGDALVLDWWRAVVAEVALAELHDDVAALQRIAAAAKEVQQALVKDFAELEAVAVPTRTLQQDVEVAEAEHEEYCEGVAPAVGQASTLGSARSRSSRRPSSTFRLRAAAFELKVDFAGSVAGRLRARFPSLASGDRPGPGSRRGGPQQLAGER